MKQIKKYFTVKWCAMISALLGMLGYSACGSKDDEDGLGPCLYGQPHAYFKVEGSVLNEEGKAVEGVKVYVQRHYGDTATTDQNGKYVFNAKSMGSYRLLWVMAEDPSGVYAADSVGLSPQYEGGDGDWYAGSCSTTHDFTLKKKPAEPVEPENTEEPETPSNPEE
jgi:putative lipoprotein (rSAM/lipoprotein system)